MTGQLRLLVFLSSKFLVESTENKIKLNNLSYSANFKPSAQHNNYH